MENAKRDLPKVSLAPSLNHVYVGGLGAIDILLTPL